MFCPSANLIVPYNDEEVALKNGNNDVTLEMDSFGNQFLHLILPADRINFLNGIDTNATFFGESDYSS